MNATDLRHFCAETQFRNSVMIFIKWVYNLNSMIMLKRLYFDPIYGNEDLTN
jgi:hypothetical protein